MCDSKPKDTLRNLPFHLSALKQKMSLDLKPCQAGPWLKNKVILQRSFFICLPLPSGSLCKECLSLLASPEFSSIDCFLDSPKTTLDSECNNPFKFIFNHCTSEDAQKTILLAPLHQKLSFLQKAKIATPTLFLRKIVTALLHVCVMLISL